MDTRRRIGRLMQLRAKIHALAKCTIALGKRAKHSSEDQRKAYLQQAFKCARAKRFLIRDLEEARAKLCAALSMSFLKLQRELTTNQECRMVELVRLGAVTSRSIFGRPSIEPVEVGRRLYAYAKRNRVPKNSPVWIIIDRLRVYDQVSMKDAVRAKRRLEGQLARQRKRLASASQIERARLVKRILLRPQSTHEIDLRVETLRSELCTAVQCLFREIIRLARRRSSREVRETAKIGARAVKGVARASHFTTAQT